MCVTFPAGAVHAARPGTGMPRHGVSQTSTARHAAVVLRGTLALLCVTLACADRDKRAEMSPVPFMMGSRYGRSPDRLMPRNDRFIMGSRYGKRSEAAGIAMPAWRSVPVGCSGTAPCRRLVCERAPLMAVYRCMRAHYRPPRDRRAAEAERDDE